jgi:hypothetical protein
MLCLLDLFDLLDGATENLMSSCQSRTHQSPRKAVKVS